MTVNAATAESRQSLWSLVIPPVVWLGHFLVSYAASAVWCGGAERSPSLGQLGIGFLLLTLVAIAFIAFEARRGWQRYRHPGESGEAVPSHHRDTPEDRHRFLGLAAFLLAALSGIATIYVAIAVAIFGSCG